MLLLDSSIHHQIDESVSLFLPNTAQPVSYISNPLLTFDLQSPGNLYSSLVASTHEFCTYVTRPHIRRRCTAQAWTLNHHILQAERKAVEDGLAFQRQPTPDSLLQYQTSRDNFVALQQCAYTESWRKDTDCINHQTSVGSMWHMINRVNKRKPPRTLHHSPAQYAQDMISTCLSKRRYAIFPPIFRRSFLPRGMSSLCV